MQTDWKSFIEQRAFVVRDVLGADRAMSTSPIAHTDASRCVDLNHMTAMRLVGPDASTFLQGYLTCDMTALEPARALFGAYCNIKGRVVTDATIVLTDGHPSLVIHASMRQSVMTSLHKYLSFSRSRFADVDAAPIILGITDPDDSTLPREPFAVVPFRGGHAIAMPGPSHRVLLLLPSPDAETVWLEYEARSQTGDAALWDLHDVRAGIAHICSATSEKFLPQMLDYDQLGAISFAKGCYLGQEIVARTQHLGRHKRHLQRLSWRGGTPSQVGESLQTPDSRRVGTLVGVAATKVDAGEALAVMADSVEGELRAGSAEFTLQ